MLHEIFIEPDRKRIVVVLTGSQAPEPLSFRVPVWRQGTDDGAGRGERFPYHTHEIRSRVLNKRTLVVRLK